MKKYIITLLVFVWSFSVQAQDKPAYRLFKANGKKVSYKKMIKKLQEADIVLFGELHNNAIAHWLELEVAKSISSSKTISLGFEMLEADNQNAVNLYLKDSINQKGLDSLARLWPNHKTDYKPLVDFAKKNKFAVIASNVPRRNAKIVVRKGLEALDSLPVSEKKFIATLPISYDANLKSYVAMTKMEHMKYMPKNMRINMPKAQAIKDATMAHFILKNLKKGDVFIHYNGSYHSDLHEGIVWYLKKHQADLKILTITTVSVDNPKKFNDDAKDKADFILQVTKDMTETY